MSDSAALLAELRRLAGGSTCAQAAEPADAWTVHGMPRGQLHEIYAAESGDAAAAVGFAVALALSADALPLFWLRTEAAEQCSGRLHAAGLAELGLAPERVVLVVTTDITASLRAAADVARCAGVGMLIVESWGPASALDLTTTRRLVLAAEVSGVTVVSLRCRAEPVASAAASRWRIASGLSTALDAQAPGQPVFDVECLRRRGGPAGQRRRVEWNRDARCFNLQDTAPMVGVGVPLALDRSAMLDQATFIRARG